MIAVRTIALRKLEMDGNRSQSRVRQDSRYWDALARRWDERIFNTLKNDRNGVVMAELTKAARDATTAADFGCGVGTYLPTLGRLFPEVHGFEQSPACAALATRRMRRRANVRVRVAQSAPRQFHGFFDLVLCVNAAIHPRRRKWHAVFRAACSLLNERGQLIVIVPSLESERMVAAAEEARERRARRGKGANGPSPKIRNNVVWIDGIPTRHYTRDELAAVLAGLGLRVSRPKKVEYSWASYDMAPPKECRGARPWDWLVVARNGGEK